MTNAEGQRFNCATCSLSGVELQHWAMGEGSPRYHCLELCKAHHFQLHECSLAVCETLEHWKAEMGDIEELKQIEILLDGLEPHRKDFRCWRTSPLSSSIRSSDCLGT